MKKIKEVVLYDDTENYKKFDETRDFLFAVQKELLEHETLLNSDLAKIRESCI